jgi:hypothetical protein
MSGRISTSTAIPRGRRGAAALRRLERGDDFVSWRAIALDFSEGRQWAITESGTADHRNAAYKAAIGQWKARNVWADDSKLAHPVSSYLYWWADHVADVDAYRDGLTDAEKTGFNHPSTIYKAFHRRAVQAAGRSRRAGGGGGSSSADAARIADLEQQLAEKDAELAAALAVVQATRDAYDQLEQDAAAKIADLERQIAGGAGLNGYPAFPLLGLDQPFTSREVTAAHRQAAKAYHPDVGGSDRQMQLLNAERQAAQRVAQPARARRGTPTTPP